MPRILIAVAHADDETLGCFSHLADNILILHATDSTPKDPRYAIKNGYSDVETYREARRLEMLEALAVAGLDPARHWHVLDHIADQETPRNVAAIREKVRSLRPDVIYTHAYEGGHPDHDTLSFALEPLTREGIEVWEFPLYHASPEGLLSVNRFLDHNSDAHPVHLSAARVEQKRRMLDCFRSQKRVIDYFAIETELFRPMRNYNFDAPPHAGPLYYEIRQHGWTWPAWRDAVKASSANR